MTDIIYPYNSMSMTLYIKYKIYCQFIDSLNYPLNYVIKTGQGNIICSINQGILTTYIKNQYLNNVSEI